jgi:hypothetical protein
VTPEELAPAASAAPAPEPAAAPAPAPEPSSAPSAAPEPSTPKSEEPGVNVGMWKAILDQTGGPEPERTLLDEIPGVRREPRAPPAPRPPAAPAPQGPGVAPAPAPKRWADKYETPDALESAYTELERYKDRAVEHAERVERLLQASMARAPQPAPPPGVDPAQWQAQQAAHQARAQQPQGLREALQAIQAESERLALGDPQADPLKLVRAVAWASRLDEESRRQYGDLAVREYQQQAQVEGALQSIQRKFFELYPDLTTARPSLLRQVAIETEDALRQSRRDYGSPQYMQAWFEETAKQARAGLRTGDGAVSAPAPMPSTRSPASTPAKTRGAPFSESPTPRSQEPVLDGQALHLARVFGRGA